MEDIDKTVIMCLIMLVLLILAMLFVPFKPELYSQSCMMGWKNKTHFCNEYHFYEAFNNWNKTDFQEKMKCNKRLWNSDGSFKLISCKEHTEIEEYWEDKGCRFEFESCKRMEQEFNQTGCITFGEVYNICCNIKNGTLIIPFIPYCDIK